MLLAIPWEEQLSCSGIMPASFSASDVSNEEEEIDDEALPETPTKIQARNQIPSPRFDAIEGNLPLEHDVLDDPEKQIRLLSRSQDDSWHLSVWDINTAPPYAALSYEWGATDGSRQLIRIHERSLSVTPNCAMALRQLWTCTKFDYFWIDAICIDQAHHNEKGHQVRAMADIYVHAASTFISLGSHDIHSLHIFDMTALQYPNEESRLTSSLDSNALQDLYCAVDTLGRREYWHRLWIYQELVLSFNLTILCGRDSLPWWSLSDLLRELESCLQEPCHFITGAERQQHDSVPTCPSRAHSHTNLKKAHRSAPGIPGFQTLLDICNRRSSRTQSREELNIYRLLDLTRHRKCLDPRDKVFGVMRLVEWPPEFQAMKVDYSQRPFEVAIEVLGHYPSQSDNVVAHAILLAHCLQLHGHDAAFDPEWIARLSGRPLPTITIPMQQSSPLREDGNGDLQATFHVTAPSFDPFPDPPGELRERFRVLMNQDDEQVGLVSRYCRRGDILLELAQGMHLVVRAQSRHQFKIIGHTLLRYDVAVKGRGDVEDVPVTEMDEGAMYEMQLHVYDLLLWACLQPRIEGGDAEKKMDWTALVKLEGMEFHAHFVSVSKILGGVDVNWAEKERILDRWEACRRGEARVGPSSRSVRNLRVRGLRGL